MTVDEILTDLKARANAKVYQMNKKNGAQSNQFGVIKDDTRNIANRIKTNHALGLALWATGNMEAITTRICYNKLKNTIKRD